MKKEEIIKYVNEHATSTILSFPDRGSSWGSSSYRGNYQRYSQVAAQHRMSAGIWRFLTAGLILILIQ